MTKLDKHGERRERQCHSGNGGLSVDF